MTAEWSWKSLFVILSKPKRLIRIIIKLDTNVNARLFVNGEHTQRLATTVLLGKVVNWHLHSMQPHEPS